LPSSGSDGVGNCDCRLQTAVNEVLQRRFRNFGISVHAEQHEQLENGVTRATRRVDSWRYRGSGGT